MNKHIELIDLMRGNFQLQGKCSISQHRNTRLSLVIERLKSTAHLIADIISRRQNRRSAIRALEDLNDHLLLDVGIERSDIPSIVTKAQNKGELP